MFDVTGDGRFVFSGINAAAARISGVSAADAYGRFFEDVVRPEQVRQALPRFQRCVESGQPMEYEEDYTRPAAGTRHLNTSLLPLPPRAGCVRRLVVLNRDITERVVREHAITQLNRVYRVLSNANKLIVHEKSRETLLEEVCRISVEDGGALMACAGFVDSETGIVKPAAWFGKEDGYLSSVTISSRNEPLGRGPTGVAIRENRHVFVSDIAAEASMEPWRDEALKRGYRSCASFPITEKGEAVGVVMAASAEPGFFTEGVVALLDELAMDISYALENLRHEQERDRAMRMVRQNDELFQELMDSIREAFWMTNGDKSETIYLSKGYKELWQRSSESLLANPDSWLEAVHPDDRERVRQRAYSQQESGKYDEEYRILRPDGTIRWIHDRAFPVRDQAGRVFRVAGLAEDITDRKRAEEQLGQSQKLESLGTLASGVAHDFNNILAIILGHASILEQRRGDAEKVAKSSAAIRKASLRGAALVNQLLAFARKTEVKLEPVSVNDLVREVSRLLTETFPKTIAVTATLQEGAPRIIADTTQMHQVLMNLCINARDAMPGGGTLDISTSVVCLEEVAAAFPQATAGQYVRIRVSDTGIGMDDETQRRVFEPFFTTKGPGKGTGLGLSLVYSIVERHRGMVGVTSALHRGTTFSVFLPIEKLPANPEQPEEKACAEASGGKETVLVIEDEEMLADMVVDVLAAKGYSVLRAGDGEEGVALFERRRREIAGVLSDYGLPKCNGGEVLRRIKAIDGNAKVILATGAVDPAQKSELLAAGAAGFLAKPYLPSDMERLIRTVIDSPPCGRAQG